MGRRDDRTSAFIDALLKVVMVSGTVSVALLAPNAVQMLDKPLQRAFKSLDKRAREREWRRIVTQMKYNGLIKGNYEFGLKLTEKGQRRLKSAEIESINIKSPKNWDRQWRILFYDIPEKHKYERDTLTRRLRELGFYQMQRSAWIHPFPCREEVFEVTRACEVNKYVTYVESGYIDNQEKLIELFKTRYQSVNFN
jgi:hypothetical protein